MHAASNAHLIIDATVFATVVLVAAFFILAVAERSLGPANMFGKLLAFWLVVVALVTVAGALTANRYGGKWFGVDLPGYEQPAPQPLPAPSDATPPAEALPPADAQPADPNLVQPSPSGG